MKTLVGKFSFKIPDGHPQAGEKVEKAYEHQACETDAEALEVVAEKKWSLADIITDVLKTNARSNAYQTAILPYKPTEVSAEDIKERMVRDYIRLGLGEDQARATVESVLAAAANNG